MTTYSIYFENNSTKGKKYGFFCEEPIVPSGSVEVYSNIFLSEHVEIDGNWEIDVTKDYYAWCGTAPLEMAPGVVVSTGQGKRVTLGAAGSPGTTCHMYDNGGRPAFKKDLTRTASVGCYEIDTSDDFHPDHQKFLMGLGGTDAVGRMKPLASWVAYPNERVNIQPVTRFYIGAFDFHERTVVKTSSVSNSCAKIFFDEHPGMYAAIVRQLSNGSFDVKYAPRANFVRKVESLKSKALQTAQLKQQMQLAQALNTSIGNQELDDDFGMVQGVQSKETDGPIIYKCTLVWMENPTPIQKQAVLTQLIDNMTSSSRNYEFQQSNIGGSMLMAEFSHYPPSNLQNAQRDWQRSVAELPAGLKIFTADPRVQPASGLQERQFGGLQSQRETGRMQNMQYQGRQYENNMNQNNMYQSDMYQGQDYEELQYQNELNQNGHYQNGMPQSGQSGDRQYQTQQYSNRSHVSGQRNSVRSQSTGTNFVQRVANESQHHGRNMSGMNNMGNETMEAKKQRARRLLEQQGININDLGLGNMNLNGVSLNGVH